MDRTIRGYAVFSSTKLAFDFSFLYPADWDLREITEKDSSEVVVMGPRNRDGTYSSGLDVSVTPTRQTGGEFGTVDEVVGDYLEKSKNLPGFKLISKTTGSLGLCAATELLISYVMPLPLHHVEPRDTIIMERKIVFRKGQRFYELSYKAAEEDYPAFLEAFRRAMQTFEFRPKRVKERKAQEFRPLVTPAPALAVREEGAEYRIAGQGEGKMSESAAMIEKRVTLSPEGAVRLSAFARGQGVSEEEIIRRLINTFLAGAGIQGEEEEEVSRREWQALGMAAFERAWDNEEDAIYDNWRELYGVSEG